MAEDRPPLSAAAQSGDVSRLRQLLKLFGADADERSGSRRETPLLLAIENGHTGAVVVLVACGADVNATTADGWTALHSAAQEEQPEVVALLLRHGADLHARTSIGRHGVQPLHVAAFNGRLGAVKVLIAHGADVRSADSSGFRPMDNAKHWVEACACRLVEPDRRYGAVIALLAKVGEMDSAAEGRRFAQRSWGLHVVSALSDVVAEVRPEAGPVETGLASGAY